MFHCYRSARPDHDNIELLSADTSMVSLIKSRSNYSTVLTMGLPRIIGIGALGKRGKRNEFKRRCRRLKGNLRYPNDAPHFPGAFSPHPTDLVPLRNVRIDLPTVIAERDLPGKITVSYSQKDNLLSISLPRNGTVIENPINQMKWMASKRGVSGTPNICDNLTADITAKCADIEVYRFRRAEEEAEITRCNVSVSVTTMAQSQQEEQTRHSTVKIKEFRNWRKMSAKILDCNCFKGCSERNPNDDDD